MRRLSSCSLFGNFFPMKGMRQNVTGMRVQLSTPSTGKGITRMLVHRFQYDIVYVTSLICRKHETAYMIYTYYRQKSFLNRCPTVQLQAQLYWSSCTLLRYLIDHSQQNLGQRIVSHQSIYGVPFGNVLTTVSRLIACIYCDTQMLATSQTNVSQNLVKFKFKVRHSTWITHRMTVEAFGYTNVNSEAARSQQINFYTINH